MKTHIIQFRTNGGIAYCSECRAVTLTDLELNRLWWAPYQAHFLFVSSFCEKCYDPLFRDPKYSTSHREAVVNKITRALL